MKTFVVVNPASSNGRTLKRWPEVEQGLKARFGELEVAMTTAPGEGESLARAAGLRGASRVVSVGGDGTHSEVVNGLMSLDGPRPVLVPITSGTGGDMRRTFGVEPGPLAALENLDSARVRRVDVGSYSFLDNSGRESRRYFLNILSLGLGGLVDQAVNSTSKALGGRVSFFWGSLRALVAYRNLEVELTLDSGASLQRRVMLVAVCNGRFFGGGMMIAPQADPGDSLFDVVILGDLSKPGLAGLSRSIYAGTHLSHPKVEHFRASRVQVSAPVPAFLDVDGEALGSTPISVELIPSGLELLI